jgi:flagellar assembly protein FliH
MANSSEWIAALAQVPAPAPAWLALVDAPQGFREAFPFAASAPELEAQPVHEPSDDALTRAYSEGLAAGRAEALAESEAATARQRALRLAFRALDETALQALADDLAATVIALCESTLAGCAIDRVSLLTRCQAAAARIGGAADMLALRLHPDDIALLDEGAMAGWQMKPDPALERGALVVEGPEGSVSDGPAEWRRAIAAAVRG